MAEISKIMVGIDGSKESVNASDYAISIAKRHNAELIGVNVLTSDIGYAGCCSGYEANYDKLHDTRPNAEDPDKNKEKKTTADVA